VLDALRRLRSPGLGIIGQVVRFGLAGALVAGVYIVSTLLLAHVAALPFQVALALGFALALATHFALQRLFVWVDDAGFALSLDRQAGRYLAIALTQYALTAAATALLPGAIGASTDVVYLAVTAVLSASNFLLLRSHVFHPLREHPLPEPPLPGSRSRSQP
jgi:putative flippase GtrA